ncbi:MAG TPA: hypothetical protein VFC39_16220 [Acidobacteriaceae bacterium]|nr:hypothetical protein [Acidobacteriaceae bacterium]
MPDISDPRSDSYPAYIARVEAEAPLDQSGPLPLAVPTLAFIPEDRRKCYARTMDGTFKLAFLNRDDKESVAAYAENIASRKLPVFSPGESPESAAGRDKVAAQRSQAALDIANREAAAEAEARRNLAHARQIGEVNKRFGR